VTRARAVDLPRAVRRAIVAHARRVRPSECCGLLVGRGRRVAFAVPTRNVARSPRTRYQVDPAAHLALQRIVRTLVPPADIIGVYHSHPAGPARPSATDEAEAFYAGWVHVIVGFRGRRPVVRGFENPTPRVGFGATTDAPRRFLSIILRLPS
jgi:proteasome lid subunit RPN8/RPN11